MMPSEAHKVQISPNGYAGENQSLGLKLSNSKEVIEIEQPEAEIFGWRIGDRIVEVNGTPCKDIAQLVDVMKGIKHEQRLPIQFTIKRLQEKDYDDQQYNRGGGGSIADFAPRGSSGAAGSAQPSHQHGALDGVNAVRNMIAQNSLNTH